MRSGYHLSNLGQVHPSLLLGPTGTRNPKTVANTCILL